MKMRERVVDFKDIQETLEPVFGGRFVRVVFMDDIVTISPDEKPKSEKVLTARGIFNRVVDKVDEAGEKRAVGEAIVENYVRKKNRNS
jgi:hypothetical protein